MHFVFFCRWLISRLSLIQVIDINLDTLVPHVNGPYTPDLASPIDKLGQNAVEKGWPMDIKVCLIGSCTNSSYEDMTRAASIAQQVSLEKCGCTNTF